MNPEPKNKDPKKATPEEQSPLPQLRSAKPNRPLVPIPRRYAAKKKNNKQGKRNPRAKGGSKQLRAKGKNDGMTHVIMRSPGRPVPAIKGKHHIHVSKLPPSICISPSDLPLQLCEIGKVDSKPDSQGVEKVKA